MLLWRRTVFLSTKMAKKSQTKSHLERKFKFIENVIKNESIKVEPRDIEDIATPKSETESKYFSPLQTRRQRKEKADFIQKINTKRVDLLPSPLKRLVATKINNATEEKSVLKIECVDVKKEQWEPGDWQVVLENIRQMRAAVPAPVDTMGCDKCYDEDADEKLKRFHTLVSLMLSSQTKDEVTYAAMQRLRAIGFTPETAINMNTTELEQTIHPVGFYKNKAKYLQKASQILVEKYNSDIPNNLKELMSLPGVGPKMAHLCMACAWNEVTGIGVDVHVHRITNRLRWLPKETKEPEQTRVALESWLPRNLWHEVNNLLVGFGQTICTPLRPRCGECLNRDICPSAQLSSKKKTTLLQEPNELLNTLPIKKAKFPKKKKIQL